MGQKGFLRTALVLGAAGVAIGAFGAHGLRGRVDPELMQTFETAVRYHFYHTLALLAISLGPPALWSRKWTALGCWAFTFGIVVFSGTLYLLTLTGQRWLGAITPIGGLALIAGWCSILGSVTTLAPSKD